MNCSDKQLSLQRKEFVKICSNREWLDSTCELGKGSYGTVNIACDDKSCSYAVKKVEFKIDKDGSLNREEFDDESNILLAIERCKTITDVFPKVHDVFECDNVGYIVMDRMDGTLRDWVDSVYRREQEITKEAYIDLTQQIITLVMKMHQIGYLHNDLHAKNVFFKGFTALGTPKLYLGDMGHAEYIQPQLKILPLPDVTDAAKFFTTLDPHSLFLLEMDCVFGYQSIFYFLYDTVYQRQITSFDKHLLLQHWYEMFQAMDKYYDKFDNKLTKSEKEQQNYDFKDRLASVWEKGYPIAWIEGITSTEPMLLRIVPRHDLDRVTNIDVFDFIRHSTQNEHVKYDLKQKRQKLERIVYDLVHRTWKVPLITSTVK